MVISAKVNNSISADIELNFTNNTWSLPPSAVKWGGVMFSDRGSFEVKSWGVMWLMDGQPGRKKDSAVILHDAPTGEKDMARSAGAGRVFAPAAPKFKDSSVQWRVTKRAGANGAASGGENSKVRAKAKQIAESLVPPIGQLTNGQKPAGAVGTGCGEFPGRVLKRMPVAGPGQPNAFSLDVPGSGKLYLTSPTTHWEKFAKAIDQKFQPAKKTWVDFTGSNRPKKGDIYLLSNFGEKSKFQHVGMIISAEGSDWITADGGQGNGWQSGLIRRKFYPSGQIDGEFGNKAWLKGWVDLDNLREVLSQYFPADV
jgi:hypothetical protein